MIFLPANILCLIRVILSIDPQKPIIALRVLFDLVQQQFTIFVTLNAVEFIKDAVLALTYR
jgi:hypothetical protein